MILTVLLFVIIPKGFFPIQDTGVILGISEAPQSISFSAMVERQQALAGEILTDPAVASLSSFIGVDGTNSTLNETRSAVKKRQEIGRGLRLPVDQNGLRVFDDSVNKLYVMANESYEDFAKALQTEYEEDCGVTFGKVPLMALERFWFMSLHSLRTRSTAYIRRV